MVPSTSVRSWCVKVTLLNRDIAMRKISYCTLLQSFSQAYGLHYAWLSIQLVRQSFAVKSWHCIGEDILLQFTWELQLGLWTKHYTWLSTQQLMRKSEAGGLTSPVALSWLASFSGAVDFKSKIYLAKFTQKCKIVMSTGKSNVVSFSLEH